MSNSEPLTEDEHKLFLEALEKYGNGTTGQEWILISEHVGKGRSVETVKLHAQQYFMKLQNERSTREDDPAVTGVTATPVAWTREEHILFEQSLAVNDNTMEGLDKVSASLPNKSIGDVQQQYNRLRRDVQLIEQNQVRPPKYSKSQFTVHWTKAGDNTRIPIPPDSPFGMSSFMYGSVGHDDPSVGNNPLISPSTIEMIQSIPVSSGGVGAATAGAPPATATPSGTAPSVFPPPPSPMSSVIGLSIPPTPGGLGEMSPSAFLGGLSSPFSLPSGYTPTTTQPPPMSTLAHTTDAGAAPKQSPRNP